MNYPYDLKTKDYNFYSFNINLSQAIKITKYLTSSISSYIHFSTDDHGFELEDGYSTINISDSIYNCLVHFQKDTEFDYETTKEIITAIANNTDYDIQVLKDYFEKLLTDIKLDNLEYKLMDELEEHTELEKILKIEYGYSEIQFILNEDLDGLTVRYKYPKFKKIDNKYKKYGYDIIVQDYEELKQFVIDNKIEETKKEIQNELDKITKEYKSFGTDETLSENEKHKALHNTYKNIKKSFITVTTNNQEKKLYIDAIYKHMLDSIEEVENKILGGKTTRYKNELLKLMKKEGLNQISKNDKGEYFYVNLFKILTDYYNLLNSYNQKIDFLKWLDDGMLSGYVNKTTINVAESKWYEFYKIAKDKYKKNHLYSVYFSFLHNTKKISFEILKKIFRVTQLTRDPIKIYSLPPLY